MNWEAANFRVILGAERKIRSLLLKLLQRMINTRFVLLKNVRTLRKSKDSFVQQGHYIGNRASYIKKRNVVSVEKISVLLDVLPKQYRLVEI